MIKKKLLTVVAGTRPNLIKIAPLIRAINSQNFFDLRVVYTQQHKSRIMSKVFFEELGIPLNSKILKYKGKTQLQTLSNIMMEFELDCIQFPPSCVIVVGDVDSTLACALVAKKLNIYLAHVEAGLRSNDFKMPEEINRIATDAISDIFFITEKSAYYNLIKEGHNKNKIHNVGNVMIDNLYFQKKKLNHFMINKLYTTKLKKKYKSSYAVLTLHRPSNVDNKKTLNNIIKVLNKISKKIPIIFPVHPRTKKNIDKFKINFNKNILKIKPLSYMEFLNLWRDSSIVITDSGGLQEETSALGIKCLTIRENTERPITIEKGTNILAGINEVKILKSFRKKMNEVSRYKRIPLWDGKSSERIIKKLYQERKKMV